MVSDQYQKALSKTNIDFRISRDGSTFWVNDSEPSQRESPQSAKSIPEILEKEKVTVRELNKLTGRLSSTAIAVLPATLHYCHIQHQPIQVNLSQLLWLFHGGGKERTIMVERKFDSVQREIFNFSATSNNNKLRCIITRLGSELSNQDTRWWEHGPWKNESVT